MLQQYHNKEEFLSQLQNDSDITPVKRTFVPWLCYDIISMIKREFARHHDFVAIWFFCYERLFCIWH